MNVVSRCYSQKKWGYAYIHQACWSCAIIEFMILQWLNLKSPLTQLFAPLLTIFVSNPAYVRRFCDLDRIEMGHFHASAFYKYINTVKRNFFTYVNKNYIGRRRMEPVVISECLFVDDQVITAKTPEDL